MSQTPSLTHTAQGSHSTNRVWWIGAVLITLAFITFMLLVTQDVQRTFAFSATSVTGERVALDDYGGKVVMLNFWATWCPPCREEMPHIETVYEQYRDRGFTVLAINDAEQLNLVRPFVAEYGLTFPVLLDYSSDIQDQFGINAYPTSLFLDAAGKVYATHPGAASVEQLTAYIETGLKRSTQE